MVRAEKCSESGLIMSCMVSTLHCMYGLFFIAPNPLISLGAFVLFLVSVLSHQALNHVCDG